MRHHKREETHGDTPAYNMHQARTQDRMNGRRYDTRLRPRTHEHLRETNMDERLTTSGETARPTLCLGQRHAPNNTSVSG